MWNPHQYCRYEDQRSRPFFDLCGRLQIREPGRIVDLGCGTGSLTSTLALRWPQARVTGVDQSRQMLEKAAPHAIEGRLEFVRAHLADWEPDEPLDLIISNACFHWVPDHQALLTRLTAQLSLTGTLAFQIPNNFQEPSHRLVRELSQSPQWAPRLTALSPLPFTIHPPAWYVSHLCNLGLEVEAWETIYQQILPGEDPVLEWIRGSTLRPILSHLPFDQQEEFLASLAPKLRAAYPRRDFGTLFPFRRLFFVGHKRSRESS